jgi:hypothetical protein
MPLDNEDVPVIEPSDPQPIIDPEVVEVTEEVPDPVIDNACPHGVTPWRACSVCVG